MTTNNTAKLKSVPTQSNVARLKRPSSARSTPRAPRAAPGVVGQVRAAFAPKARLATVLGCLAGALPPLAAFVLAHLPRPVAWYLWAIVAGALLFSAKTVYQWASMAFADPWKAFGFVVLLEGVMTLSPVAWLSYIALGYLIAINGIATGCTLSKGA